MSPPLPAGRATPRRTAAARVATAAVLVAATLAPAARAAAQTPAPPTAPAAAPAPVPTGATAPAFALPAVTRYGPLGRAVGPADFLGKTLVIAFFYRARTKG